MDSPRAKRSYRKKCSHCGKDVDRKTEEQHLLLAELQAEVLARFAARHDALPQEIEVDFGNELGGDFDVFAAIDALDNEEVVETEEETVQLEAMPAPVFMNPADGTADDADEVTVPLTPQEQATLKQPVCAGSPVTVDAFSMLTMQWRLDHSIPNGAVEDILHLLSSVVLPEGNLVPRTLPALRSHAFGSIEHQVHTVAYDDCPKRCHLYLDDDARTACPTCGTARFDAAGDPLSQVRYAPFRYKLRSLMGSAATAKAIDAARAHVYSQETPSARKSVLDGDWARDLQAQGVIDANTVVVSAGFDGMQMFSKSGRSLWIGYLFVEGLDPLTRQKRIFIHILTLIDGEPSDMGSYMMPFVNEMNDLSTNGDNFVNANRGGIVEHLRVVVLHIYGDTPAICKILQFLGPGAIHACRKCPITGCNAGEALAQSRAASRAGEGDEDNVPGADDEDIRHPPPEPPVDANGKKQRTKYYPATRESLQLPLRTHEETRQAAAIASRDLFTTDKDFEEYCTHAGLKGLSVLFQLMFCDVIRATPTDPMHFIWLGFCRTLLIFLMKQLTPAQRRQVNNFVKTTAVPHDVTRVPLNPATKCSTFIADAMRSFVMTYSIAALEDVLELRYLTHWKKLVYILGQVMDYEPKDVNLDRVKPVLDEFLIETTVLYPHSCNTLNLHLFSHFINTIKEGGPAAHISNFRLETMNGVVKGMVTSYRLPVTSAWNRLSDLEQLEFVRATNPDVLDPERYAHPRNPLHPRMLQRINDGCVDQVGNGIVSRTKVPNPTVDIANFVSVMARYLRREHPAITGDEIKTMFIAGTIEYYGHLDLECLPQRSRRVSTDTRNPGINNRDSSYVIVTRTGGDNVAQVKEIVVVEYEERLHTLVLLTVFPYQVPPSSLSVDQPMATIDITGAFMEVVETRRVRRKVIILDRRAQPDHPYVADYQRYGGLD